MIVRCSNCNRYLGDIEMAEGLLRCPRCKENNPLKIVSQKFLGNKRKVIERFTR